jgi:class 3 adenylate cyclase
MNAADQQFCKECGAGRDPGHVSLPSPYTPQHLVDHILLSRSALEGERKRVTVMFCDIANSTSIAAEVGAEKMHGMLNAFFDLALTEVHRYEGTVNQFLGDGFMALFGAPLAHEDHTRRAALAAAAIQARLQIAGSSGATDFTNIRVRMGIHTGEVVVGKIGDNLRMDYTAVGDTTNLAARLQQAAKPGSICVSEDVYTAVRAYFDATALGRQTLKGIAEPVVVYELGSMQSHAEAGSRARSIGIGSNLVGRESESEALSERLTALLHGEGGVIALVGEPGLGKSRLVAEVKRNAAQYDCLWLEGRGLSFGHNLSYWPFIEILKQYFGIEEDDTEDQSWSKLESGVQVLFGQATSDLLPYIATVLAVHLPREYQERVKYLDSQGLGRQVFLSMRRLFEHLAQQRPLVLLFEDWHWADRSSVALAEHLLSLVAATPLLVWCVSRPDPDGPIARIKRAVADNPTYSFQEVVLSPLSEASSVTLIRNLVGSFDFPITLREQILKKTEGNPFFIEEVIRSLVTDGFLSRRARDHSWYLAKAVNQLNLPDTVQGLILARIDRLDEEVKQVVKLHP